MLFRSQGAIESKQRLLISKLEIEEITLAEGCPRRRCQSKAEDSVDTTEDARAAD